MKCSAMPTLPLVGREAEISEIRSLLDDAQGEQGRTLFLVGESGQGKTRLVRLATELASRRGWTVAEGRAYAVEAGVPYAPVSDAMLPLLRGMDASSLAVLTRGAEAELSVIVPALDPAPIRAGGQIEAPEARSRLLWTFGQLLSRIATRAPLLLVLEDLQWADPSTMELLHFVGRQLQSQRIAMLVSYNEAWRDGNPLLRRTEQSLIGMGSASVQRVDALDQDATARLVRETFDADEAAVRDFTGLLFAWTRGNPLFIELTLQALVDSGKLRQVDGRWSGWEMERIDVPASVRDVVRERLDRLSPAARSLAEIHAVVGMRAGYETLRRMGGGDEPSFVEGLEELCRARIMVEESQGEALVYDFAHPVLRETLYSELGLARSRLLHAAVAETLERLHGEGSTAHADELAFHFSRAGGVDVAEKAAKYLVVAGRNALSRHAYREAAEYLRRALETGDGTGAEPDDELITTLARARQRTGDYEGAIELWRRALDRAQVRRDSGAVAAAERRLGLAHHWSGRPAEALEHYAAGLAATGADGDAGLRARLHLARGESLMELGRPIHAVGELGAARRLAEQTDDAALLSRIHRALLLLHTWTGPPAAAREHGREALALSRRTGDEGLAATAHWALAAMEGLTGHLDAMAEHIGESERLAERIRSPLHQAWVAEVSLEHLAATGRWDAAVAVGERGIAQARVFRQPTLLPRLLVWTALLHLARGETERGRAYVEEAWRISGAGLRDRAPDVHTVVPAHTGMAAYHLAVGDYEESVRVGEAGVEIAYESGYTVWAIHRLLPTLGEAYLLKRDLEGARRVGDRLRRGSEQMEHPAGIAWADTCDALLVYLGGELARSAELLRGVAERMDEVGIVPDAARARRQYAARLRDLGERDEALRQLRMIHEVFLRLGAQPELHATREQIRELGARPPMREPSGAGVAGLTPREVEIVRLVASRRSNKAIGQALDISARTVSTHLSNIFRKLEVGSRGELAEVARKLDLPG
jgi:DNA-binding CsgD family transcriptional regulator/tetratricopeptide (TPR) repeat protein